MEEETHCTVCEKEITSPYHQQWSVEIGEGVIVCEECFAAQNQPLNMDTVFDALEDMECEMKAEEALKEQLEDPDKRCQHCGILACDSWFGDWQNDLYCSEECAELDV